MDETKNDASKCFTTAPLSAWQESYKSESEWWLFMTNIGKVGSACVPLLAHVLSTSPFICANQSKPQQAHTIGR